MGQTGASDHAELRRGGTDFLLGVARRWELSTVVIGCGVCVVKDSGCLVEEKLQEREGKGWKPRLLELTGEMASRDPGQERRGASGAHIQCALGLQNRSFTKRRQARGACAFC